MNNFDGLEILHYELGNISSGASTSITDAFGAGNDLGDLQNVMDRAVGGAGWLSINPTSGDVPAHSSVEVTVTFNSTGLKPGSYNANIKISSNDPVHNSKEVPAKLRVIGRPLIYTTPDTLKYGKVYVGIASVDTLHIENMGSDVLQVSAVTVSDTAFHLNKTSLSIAAGAQENLFITYTARTAGVFAATLSMHSNDSSHLTVTVPIRGESFYPPVMTTAPDSFVVTVKEGDSTTSKLTIGNTGLGALQWQISQGTVIGLSMQKLVNRTEAERSVIMQKQVQTKGNNTGQATVSPYALNALLTATGAMRILLWTGYVDSTFGGELENIMNAIKQYKSDVTFNMTTTTSPTMFSTLLAQTDVFIMPEQESVSDLSSLGDSFASALASFVQSGKTMIVLDFYKMGATTFLNATGLLTINNVTPSSSYTAIVQDATSPLVVGVSSTFMALDGSNYHTSPNGRKIIREQVTGNNIVTLRDVGAGRVIYMGMDFFSYNADMARVLANAVSSSLSNNWITASPISGIVAPGDSQEVAVTFNAKSLKVGVYGSSLTIYNNHPVNNMKILPVNLTVSKKSDIEDDELIIPKVFALYQNYPNPFNPSTTIRYDIPKTVRVQLYIYNILGERVRILVDEEQSPRSYAVQWDGRTRNGTAATGVYFVTIRAGEFRKVIKMIMLK